MAERPDLRQIASNIRDSLADYDREALLEILTYVFKEYVVEGPPPLLVNQVERLEEFEGVSFGMLMGALQTRLDIPELSLFSVDGDAVSVRVGGVMTALNAGLDSAGSAGRHADQPVEVAASSSRAAAAPEPAPRPGVQIVETELHRRPDRVSAPARDSVREAVNRGRGDLVGGTAGEQRPVGTPRGDAAHQNSQQQRRGVAPRPSGMSLRGRPTGGDMMPPQNQPQNQLQGGAGDKSQPSSESPPAEPSAPDGDDAAVRFSLLELD